MISIGRLVDRNTDGTIQRRRDGSLRARRAPIACAHVMIDPQAFQVLKLFGRYPDPVAVYAELLTHLTTLCEIDSATSEDYMCEPFMRERTGLTVQDHQRLTISRYDTLVGLRPPCYIMPVLQGYEPSEYADHLHQYRRRLKRGMWVGVGSVCKRNADPSAIRDVLYSILRERPDLRLHGFGLKTTAMRWPLIRQMLHSADSLAWSYHARKNGRDGNDWREAEAFTRRVQGVDLSDLPMFKENRYEA